MIMMSLAVCAGSQRPLQGLVSKSAPGHLADPVHGHRRQAGAGCIAGHAEQQEYIEVAVLWMWSLERCGFLMEQGELSHTVEQCFRCALYRHSQVQLRFMF